MIVVTVARRPLLEANVASNVLAHGTGALNIDGCRIQSDSMPTPTKAPGWDSYNKTNAEQGYRPTDYAQGDALYTPSIKGRWPANLVLEHKSGCKQEGECEPGCPVAELDESAGDRPGMSGGGDQGNNKKTGYEVVPSFNRKPSAPFIRGDRGGASRFFKQVGGEKPR